MLELVLMVVAIFALVAAALFLLPDLYVRWLKRDARRRTRSSARIRLSTAKAENEPPDTL